MKLAASIVTALGLLIGACAATDKREAATAVRRADSGLVRQRSLEDNKIILGGSSIIEAALTDPSSGAYDLFGADVFGVSFLGAYRLLCAFCVSSAYGCGFGAPVFGAHLFGADVFGVSFLGAYGLFGAFCVSGAYGFGVPVFGAYDLFGVPVFGADLFSAPVFGDRAHRAAVVGADVFWFRDRVFGADFFGVSFLGAYGLFGAFCVSGAYGFGVPVFGAYHLFGVPVFGAYDLFSAPVFGDRAHRAAVVGADVSGSGTVSSVPPSAFPFGAPTGTPTSISTGVCVDDANFRLNDKERLGCVWVSKKRDTRCALVHKAQSQPASAYCRGTCSESCFTEEPTVAPTTEPTFTPSDGSRCLDDDNFIIGKKSCKWVGKNPTKRCAKKSDGSGTRAMDACPSVCNLRCTCANSKKSFKFEKSRVLCKIMRKEHCKAASGKKIVADHCPRKCNDCYPGIIIQ
eukprot:CAMPEP_0201251764 /NCGR_PEP_ID=MMETSP0852-20130820/66528_1 /ASSEMBLY_ACC=CAM_ASM_000632 /TAXON_ID=183588 /ORGANISM="Pseudo-nitzschia fraudulenta, Strain WWA7" /LENGTH=457 /DNA_ID=CAMNT_0047551377 /DNA_START=102 /DNA_END=1475 /DNA_ORIENTATION=-